MGKQANGLFEHMTQFIRAGWPKVLPAGAVVVYTVLAWHQGQNSEAWPSLATLAEETGLSRSNVIASLRRLQEAGLVTRQWAGNRAPGRSAIVTPVPPCPEAGLGLKQNRSRRKRAMTPSATGSEAGLVQASPETELVLKQNPTGSKTEPALVLNQNHSGSKSEPVTEHLQPSTDEGSGAVFSTGTPHRTHHIEHPIEHPKDPPHKDPPQGDVQKRSRKVKRGPDYSPEFEAAWAEYPRKMDKLGAYLAWNARLKQKLPDGRPVTVLMLQTATRHYAEECRRKGKPQDYIMHGATFYGPRLRFLDYLDPPSTGPGRRETALDRMLREAMQRDQHRSPRTAQAHRGSDAGQGVRAAEH